MSAVRTYVHLPTEVQAVQWLGRYDDLPAKWQESGAFTTRADSSLTVVTSRGPADVEVGDYLVYSWGEYWPIHEPRFIATYEAKAAGDTGTAVWRSGGPDEPGPPDRRPGG